MTPGKTGQKCHPAWSGALKWIAMILWTMAIGFSTFGCSENDSPIVLGGVDGTAACPCVDGWSCVLEMCRRECALDADCGEGTFCAVGGVCLPSDEPFTFPAGSAIPVKLDLLWVIDNSSSMCQEQASLARSFNSFVTQLDSYLNVDINLAVTTTDALMGQGKFSNTPATVFPNACSETKKLPCAANTECVDAFGASWVCNPPQSTGGSLLLYNKNGSLNSSCTYSCDSNADCCENFCYVDECGDDMSCVDQMCGDSEDDCTQTCKAPGGGSDELKNCVAQPDTGDCPSGIPTVLTETSLEYFPCIATVGAVQSFTANLESGLKTAWMALDPSGLQAEQSAGFLRDDAYLIIVFVTDEDDCSIDEDFSSPSFDCEDDGDCPGYTLCKQGLCHGIVKKDYYNICALLGEYKGEAHHDCAYDKDCQDCESDADCDEGWYCKVDKCRPYIYGFNTISSVQKPAGTPLFALTPVSKYYSQLRSLKADPAKVLVAAIVGDAIIKKSDQKSLISEDCLEDEKMERCQNYLVAKADASNKCLEDPIADGCEDFLALKQACAQECYVASKGDNKNPQAKNSYVCTSPYGTSDWGNRYIRLAEMFGPNGIVGNLCDSGGIGTSLDATAELLLKRMTRVCLPFPVRTGEHVKVTRGLPGGEALTLVEGAPPEGDFQVVYPEYGCCFRNDLGECTGSETALMFTEVLDPAAEIDVTYIVAPISGPR